MQTIVVSGSTTIYNIQRELTLHRLYPAMQPLPYILMNGCRNHLLKSSDTMSKLSAGPLLHFTICCLFLGGSGLCFLFYQFVLTNWCDTIILRQMHPQCWRII